MKLELKRAVLNMNKRKAGKRLVDLPADLPTITDTESEFENGQQRRKQRTERWLEDIEYEDLQTENQKRLVCLLAKELHDNPREYNPVLSGIPPHSICYPIPSSQKTPYIGFTTPLGVVPKPATSRTGGTWIRNYQPKNFSPLSQVRNVETRIKKVNFRQDDEDVDQPAAKKPFRIKISIGKKSKSQ